MTATAELFNAFVVLVVLQCMIQIDIVGLFCSSLHYDIKAYIFKSLLLFKTHYIPNTLKYLTYGAPNPKT